MRSLPGSFVTIGSVAAEAWLDELTYVVNGADEELMAMVAGGDREAYGVLVRRHVDPLYNYAFRLCRVSADAEDLVQETLLKAWTSASSFNPRRAELTTWLHRILRNRFIDTTRKGRIEVAEEVCLKDVAEAFHDTGSDAVNADATLNQLIGGLPESQRSALLLSHAQGFSNRQIAHILGVSVRAAESLLARGRENMRNAYATLTNASADRTRTTGNR